MKKFLALILFTFLFNLISCGSGGGGGSSSYLYVVPYFSGYYEGQWSSESYVSSGKATMHLVQQGQKVYGVIHIYSTQGNPVNYNGTVNGIVSSAEPPGDITLFFGGFTALGDTNKGTYGASIQGQFTSDQGWTATFALARH